MPVSPNVIRQSKKEQARTKDDFDAPPNEPYSAGYFSKSDSNLEFSDALNKA